MNKVYKDFFEKIVSAYRKDTEWTVFVRVCFDITDDRLKTSVGEYILDALVEVDFKHLVDKYISDGCTESESINKTMCYICEKISTDSKLMEECKGSIDWFDEYNVSKWLSEQIDAYQPELADNEY